MSGSTATDDTWDLPPPVTDPTDPLRVKAYDPASTAQMIGIWPPPGNAPGPMVAPNIQTSVRPDGTVAPYKPPPPLSQVQGQQVAANSNATTLAAPVQPAAARPTAAPPDGADRRMVPWDQARLMIQRGEGTTGDQNIWNYRHAERPDYFTAGGPYQIVDSTWREGGQLAGVDVSQWQHAIDAPKEVQEQVAHALYDKYGFKPWTKGAGGSLNPDGTVADNARTLGAGPGYEEYMRRGLAMFPQTYDPASIIAERRRIDQQQEAEERPLIEARQRRQQQEEAEADQRYSELQRQHDLNDPALKPWTQKPPQGDPIGGLASLGSVFAALAAGFSHTPAIAAMNGMAAAIDARNEGNQKQYDEAFKAYQYNAQLALDRNEIVQKAYDAAWARVKENPELGLAELRSVSQIYDDERSRVLFESGQLEKADEINRARIEAASKWAIEQQKLDNINMFGPPAGSEDAKEVEARTRELMAQNPEMSLYAARAQANDELKKKNAALKPQTAAQGTEANARAIAVGRFTQENGRPPTDDEIAHDPDFAQMMTEARAAAKPMTPAQRKEADADAQAEAAFKDQYGHAPSPEELKGPEMASLRQSARAGEAMGGSANVKAMAHLIANYQAAPPSTTRGIGAAIMAEVVKENPSYNARLYNAENKALGNFYGGADGTSVKSLNVSILHLDTFQDLADALRTGDVRMINRLGQQVAAETGQAAPTNFDTAKQIIGQEIIKAIIAGGGGVTERQAMEDHLSRSNSPEQLAGTIDVARQLLGGQLAGFQQKYDATTGMKDQAPFSQLLLPRTREVLAASAEAAGKARGNRGDTEPPPVNLLTEGKYTHFDNGQVWLLQNGKPVLVPPGQVP